MARLFRGAGEPRRDPLGTEPMYRIKQWLVAGFVYRSLLRDFVRQDINGRFAGSMGGLIWTVLTPLANIFIYVFVFSAILRVRIPAAETGTDKFVVFLLSGLFPWMAFAEALGRSTSLLLDKASLITKVSFAVEILPFVGTLAPFVINGIGFSVFLAYLVLQGYGGMTWLLLPAVVVSHALFTVGVVAVSSAICVFIRDIQHIVGLLVSVWFYLTPIVYPTSLVPARFQEWLLVNPMYLFIELYRQVLLRDVFSLKLFVAVTVMSTVVFLIGGWLFMRIKHAFADVL
jgi:lipopolysaccharide transport system permease protein